MLMPAPWVVVVLGYARVCPAQRLLRVRFFRDPPRNGCNFFKAVHSTSENEKKEKKRSDRQEYVSLYYSTNHYTNEDVLSSPSPRKRENTSTFRELNLDQQSFEDSYWSPA